MLRLSYYGDSVLRKDTLPVDSFDEQLEKLAQEMLETMYENKGVGLAAPQVGISRSLIVVDVGQEETGHFDPIILVNPDIYEFSGSVVMEEGCLSIPDVRIEVERPERIKVRYQDVNGDKRKLRCDGWLARVIQHEADHLTGRLMTDYLSPVKRNLIRSKLKKISKGELPAGVQQP